MLWAEFQYVVREVFASAHATLPLAPASAPVLFTIYHILDSQANRESTGLQVYYLITSISRVYLRSSAEPWRWRMTRNHLSFSCITSSYLQQLTYRPEFWLLKLNEGRRFWEGTPDQFNNHTHLCYCTYYISSMANTLTGYDGLKIKHTGGGIVQLLFVIPTRERASESVFVSQAGQCNFRLTTI